MRFSLILVVLAGLFSAAGAFAASTCPVSSTADTNTSGTLRYCLNNAFAGDVIHFTTTGTIALTSALPAISQNLTIMGPGVSNITVSGSNLYQVFNVSSGTVTISGLTIANGSSTNGGGINNAGTLTLANDVIYGNTASVDGGGIYNTGTLTVKDCTFSSDSAESGGGLMIYSGTATVTYSTISGNTASDDGGGIYSEASLTLTNSTVSANTASNGGGIGVGGGTLTLANSIVAGNSATTDYADIDGGYTDNGGNQASSNSSGTSTIAIKLAELGNYGGAMQTMLPLPGSPAICDGLTANVPGGVTADERGFANTNTTYTTGTCVDAGAVQTNYQSVQFTNVPGGGAYTAVTNIAVSPAPIVSVTENSQNIGAVPVKLTDASLTVTGLGPVTTIGGTGATFGSVEDSAVEDTTLEASLQITPAAISPPYTLTAGASFDTSAAAPASLTSPTPTPGTGYPSTQLPGTTVAFIWTPGNATNFEFWLGTMGPGTTNLYNSHEVSATTETVSGLPNNGEQVYARLYWLIAGVWHYADYTYMAYGSATQGVLTTPTPGTTLSGTSVTFSWNPSNINTHYELYVGTSAGSSNIYGSGNVTATTETVNDIPTNGQTLYVRLYTLIDGVFQFTDYTYKASGSPISAALYSPNPVTQNTLSGTSVTFMWTPGNLATHFYLLVGSTGPGTSNLYSTVNVTATSATVSDLPNNGQSVYVRLGSLINGGWQYLDYTYVASGSPTPAVLTTPSPGSQFTSTSVTFDWTPGNVATHFMLYLGTSVGSNNLYNSQNVTATSETVNGLPNNGETIYARLYWLVDGAWHYTDYTYTAF